MSEELEPTDDLPATLVYVSDTAPGISRRRHGKGFSYRHPDGKPVAAADRARILSLGIPPAYRDVWICRLAAGHLQATGRDDRGRKQYRYHPDWTAWRTGSKFGHLVGFGHALGALRRRVDRDLRGDVGALDHTLAALTLLLDRAALRIGNPAYVTENRTFGASTLLARHIKLEDGIVRLRYRAKGGKKISQSLRDKKLHRILNAIGDLPGRNLFTWIDETGAVRTVGSHHVNAYLAAATGLPAVTAKTFRTWSGSLAAFRAATAAEDRLTVKMLAEAAAQTLYNTPAVSKSSYIHPAILGLATLPAPERMELLDTITPTQDALLRRDERRMLAFLEQHESPMG